MISKQVGTVLTEEDLLWRLVCIIYPLLQLSMEHNNNCHPATCSDTKNSMSCATEDLVARLRLHMAMANSPLDENYEVGIGVVVSIGATKNRRRKEINGAELLSSITCLLSSRSPSPNQIIIYTLSSYSYLWMHLGRFYLMCVGPISSII